MNSCFNNILGSYQKWHIGDDVRTILMSDTAITAHVGSRIFPLIIPENEDGDCIVYSRQHYNKKSVKMGVWEDECTLALTVISDNYDNSVTIAEAIDNALTGQVEINDTKLIFELADSSETFEDFKYIQVLMFRIK